MNPNRRQIRSARPLRRRALRLVLATGVAVAGLAAVAPAAANAAPHPPTAGTSTWG